MNQTIKNRYHVFQRGWGTYYCEDLVTKKQTTLRTRDKDEAFRLVVAKNENDEAPAFSLHLARVYWKAGEAACPMHRLGVVSQCLLGETLRETAFQGPLRPRIPITMQGNPGNPQPITPLLELRRPNDVCLVETTSLASKLLGGNQKLRQTR
jgi:hypothetical protein